MQPSQRHGARPLSVGYARISSRNQIKSYRCSYVPSSTKILLYSVHINYISIRQHSYVGEDKLTNTTKSRIALF